MSAGFKGLEPGSELTVPAHRDLGEPELAYTYVDAVGVPLFAVARFATTNEAGEPDKDFRQGHPTGANGQSWTWNLKGVDPVLYRLDELVEHLASGAPGPVYITEGEKDADRLRAHLAERGLPGVVTSVPMGSHKWRESYTDTLRGARHVIFLVDNDEAGFKGGRVAADELGPHVDRLQILRPALDHPHADISDHLDADLSLEELLGLEAEPAAEEAPPFRIDVYSAKDLAGLPLPQDEPELVGPFLRRGRITLLGGPTGQGKTTLGAQMLSAGANGGEFVGYEVEGGLLELVLDLEQHLEDIQEQLDAVGLADSELVDYAPIPEGLQIDRDPEHLAELERIVAAKPYDVVRIDPFYKLHAGDSSDEEQARALVRLTRRWVNEYGFALLIDTHVRKRIEGTTGFKLDDLFGSSLFSRDPEVILGLQLIEDGFSRLHIFKARGRRGDIRTGQTIDLLYSDDELFRRKPDEAERDLRAALLELASDHAWRTLKEWKAKPGRADVDPDAPNYVELRGGIGAGETKVKEALGELQVEEVFEYAEGPGGRSSQARCWRLKPTAPGAQGTPGQSGQSGGFRDSTSATASLIPIPKGSAGRQGSSPSTALEAEGTFGDSELADEDEVERLAELAREAQDEAGDAGGEEATS